MQSNANRFKSRRKSPWDVLPVRTSSEDFIRNDALLHYSQRHPEIRSSDEIRLVNSYHPHSCRCCGSVDFKKDGFSSNGIQIYRCNSCHSKFTVLTGTIFDGHKISITEWIEYWRNLLAYLSLNADSWNNKNAYTTSRYWFKKTCLLLRDIQDSVLLSGKVYCDETYLPVRSEDIIRKENNHRLRGNSRNQMCIETITDGKTVFAKFIGLGAPAQKKVYEALKDHIQPGSTLITDKAVCHRMLVRKLNLENIEYDSKEIKALPDKENPMNEINQLHNLLQKFLRAHSGFEREDLQDYLNLFALAYNAPDDMYEKIDLLLNLSFVKQNYSDTEPCLPQQSQNQKVKSTRVQITPLPNTGTRYFSFLKRRQS